MNDLACHLKFQRLIKKLEAIIPEHTEFLEQFPQSIKKAEFPTVEMFDELQSSLDNVKFAYLPESNRLKSVLEGQEPLRVQDLKELVRETKKHLK